MGSILPGCLPCGKAGGLQILCCQGIVVNYYNFTLDALALKPSGFCNVRVKNPEFLQPEAENFPDINRPRIWPGHHPFLILSSFDNVAEQIRVSSFCRPEKKAQIDTSVMAESKKLKVSAQTEYRLWFYQ